MPSSGPVAGPEPARAILVGVDFGGSAPFDASLDELALLAESAGDAPVARVVARRKAPDPALFIGSGKADEIKALVEGHQAEAVLFDQALSPAQQRAFDALHQGRGGHRHGGHHGHGGHGGDGPGKRFG